MLLSITKSVSIMIMNEWADVNTVRAQCIDKVAVYKYLALLISYRF